MPIDPSSPLYWKPVPVPVPTTLRGQYVTLEPINPDRHTAALWEAVLGHDELWTWLAQGPFATEADLRNSIEQKQSGTSAVFFAIVPTETGKAAGWASYMRIEPDHGVIEVGNIMLSPSLQRTS